MPIPDFQSLMLPVLKLAGDAVNIVDYGGALALVPALDDPAQEARGLLPGPESLTAELVDEHRREVEQDERRFR